MEFAFSSEVLGSILCTGLYLSLVSLMGLALGTLLRNSAGSIVTLSALLLVIPMVLSMIPGEAIANISKYLPSNAGAQLTATQITDGALTQLQGGLVMAAWAIVPLAIALVTVKRRDV
jgi:ABC-type transport system involved in multi-copper enzyme maturation permease subunit